MRWLPFEQRWRDEVVRAVLPRAGHHPPDLADFWPRFESRAPLAMRLGLRVSVWALTWSPVLTFTGLRPLGAQAEDVQDELVQRLDRSGYLWRQLLFTTKHVACFGILADPEIREALS